MAAAQTTISLRLTALDEATPVTERVRAALADLGAGRDLGGLLGEVQITPALP